MLAQLPSGWGEWFYAIADATAIGISSVMLVVVLVMLFNNIHDDPPRSHRK